MQNTAYRYETGSSAVTERSRDTCCPSVVSFSSLIPRAESFIAARCYAGAAYAIMSVCLSVTFVHSVKTNKHIFTVG